MCGALQTSTQASTPGLTHDMTHDMTFLSSALPLDVVAQACGFAGLPALSDDLVQQLLIVMR